MFNAFRMSLVSLLLVVGCVADRAPTPDEATATDEASDDSSQATSALSDDAIEPHTCALRICRTNADCTCGHAACENGGCVQILN